MKHNQETEKVRDHRVEFIEQASRIGLHAVVELIRETRLSGGKASLRVEIDGAIWEVSARCIAQKGAVMASSVLAGIGLT